MRAQQTRPNLGEIRGVLIAHGVAHRLAQWALGGLLALILVVAQTSGSWARIELREFTATTQEDGTILLRWITTEEKDTSFFRIHRAETGDGPWNKDTVIAEQDSNSDGVTDTVYEYNDRETIPGTTYFYRLEEVDLDDRLILYVIFTPSATAGQPGAPTSTPTATLTATRTSTPGASPTPSRTPNQTPSRTPSPTATNTPNDAPTPTVRPGTTPTSQGQTQPTAAVTAAATAGAPGAATATPLPAGRVATPTGQAGVNPLPTPSAAPRPGGTTPPRPGAATAPPPALPAPAATLNPQRTPTATPSPAVFASKPTEPPVLRGAAPRPTLATTQTEAAPRGDGWILALGGVAVILAALLGGVALFLSRRHHS
jgi:hypothetical protein